jgi:hypothetical protein
LYGKADTDYQITWTNRLGDVRGGTGRSLALHPAWTTRLSGLEASWEIDLDYGPQAYFSAYELGEPGPYLEVLEWAGEAGDLLIYGGQPGASYEIESTTDPAGLEGWAPVQTVTLTTTFELLEGVVPAGQDAQYRVVLTGE